MLHTIYPMQADIREENNGSASKYAEPLFSSLISRLRPRWRLQLANAFEDDDEDIFFRMLKKNADEISNAMFS